MPKPSQRSRIVATTLTAAVVVSTLVVPVSGAATKAPAKKAPAKKAAPRRGVAAPNGRPPNVAAPFLWDVPSGDSSIPQAANFERAIDAIAPNNGFFTLLIIGSDARPGERPDRTRADSIHLFVWWSAHNQGILIGIPRDSYVNIPGRGVGKINSALALGGPQLMLQTVNALTRYKNLQTNRFVLTGFDGFKKMVDELGGVNVLVKPAMNDAASGAKFAEGWFAMNGAAALAFNRNRKGVLEGDKGRSLNQGRFLLYALAKLREETSDAAGLLRWVRACQKYGVTNMNPADGLLLAQLARGMEPRNIQNIVLQGKNAKIKGQDVYVLNNGDLIGVLTDVDHDGLNNQK